MVVLKSQDLGGSGHADVLTSNGGEIKADTASQDSWRGASGELR